MCWSYTFRRSFIRSCQGFTLIFSVYMYLLYRHSGRMDAYLSASGILWCRAPTCQLACRIFIRWLVLEPWTKWCPWLHLYCHGRETHLHGFQLRGRSLQFWLCIALKDAGSWLEANCFDQWGCFRVWGLYEWSSSCESRTTHCICPSLLS